MHEEVKKCVENKDIRGLKYIFADCLVVDPTFEKYREDYEYCKKVPGVFEAYKELTPLKFDKSQWSVEYWEKIKLDLLENFATKRFEHMIEVAKVVYADKVSRLLRERKTAEEEQRQKEHLAAQRAKSAGQSPSSGKKVQTIVQDRPASAGQVNPTRYSRQSTLDAAGQEEQQKLARRKQELEIENQKVAEEERRQKERLAAQRAKYESQNTVSGSNGTKKALGIVFVAAAVIIIALVLMKVL